MYSVYSTLYVSAHVTNVVCEHSIYENVERKRTMHCPPFQEKRQARIASKSVSLPWIPPSELNRKYLSYLVSETAIHISNRSKSGEGYGWN